MSSKIEFQCFKMFNGLPSHVGQLSEDAVDSIVHKSFLKQFSTRNQLLAASRAGHFRYF